MSDAAESERDRRTTERPWFRRLVAAYTAAALRVRTWPRPARSRGRGADLDIVMLSAYPPQHYGTLSRLGRWRPYLERRAATVTVLCPCDDATYGAFGHGDIAADYAFQHAALANGIANLRRAAAADVVVLHRGLFPLGPWQRPTFENALYRLNPRVVYDFFDSIWELRAHAHAGAGGRFARWLNPADKIEHVIGGAAAVTVSNEYLAEFARRYHDDVTVLPMLLDPAPYRVRQHRPRDVVTLGWMGGPWNIERLRSIAPAIARAAARVPLRLRVVCPRSVQIPGVEIEHADHPWSFDSELRDLDSFDIGLLPLFDDAVDRGKSPFKLLQYAAAGLPIVASPVAVDAAVFEDGRAIVFARTEDEWVDALVALAGDATRRASLGSAARFALEQTYTFDAHADAFDALLRRVAGRL